MGDIVDDGNDAAERFLAASLLAAAEAKPVAIATGFCLYCEATLAPPRRWCDADCCRGWEKEQHPPGSA